MPVTRRKMLDRRRSETQQVRVGGVGVFYSWSVFPDGRVGELFIDVAKAGSALRFWSTAFVRMVSVALQHGTPLETVVGMFIDTKAEPWGEVTGHDRITKCTSIIDLVVRSLAIDFLGRDDLADRPAPDSVIDFEDGRGTGGDDA